MENIKKVKTAIVGCGMISNIYIKNLKDLFSIIELVAVCDRNPDLAEDKSATYGVGRTMTMDEIATSEEIELVVNLTPPAAHYDVIKKMLLAGKHVFTEKMFTTELNQARELVKIADEKNLYLGVAPDTILGAGIQTARKLIEAGMIGNVVSCVASINRNQARNSELMHFLRSNGGAVPYDVGIYYIAALLCLMGPIKAVTGFGASGLEHKIEFLRMGQYGDSWQIPGNNVMAGALQFENGALGTVHFNGNTISQEKNILIIYGTEGILELGDPNIFGGEVKLILPETGECIIPYTHGYDGKPQLPNPTQFDFMYGNRGIGVAEMAWAIRKKRQNRCNKELGLHTMEVLCGLDESAKTGTVIYMESRFSCKPLKSGFPSTMMNGAVPADSERSLID